MATIDVDAVNEAAHGAALPDPLVSLIAYFYI